MTSLGQTGSNSFNFAFFILKQEKGFLGTNNIYSNY